MHNMSETHEEQQSYVPGQYRPKSSLLYYFAKVVTYICHPVFMPTILAYVLMKLMPHSFDGIPEQKQKLLLISIGCSTLFFPLFTIMLLKPLGFLDDYHMPTAKERTIPLMASMIFYFWINQVIGRMPGTAIPMVLHVLTLGSFWLIIGLFMFNIFTKVSIHTGGAGSLVGMMIVVLMISPVNMLIPFCVSLVIAGLIGTVRLILKAHTPTQITLGYLLGILSMVGAYFYLK